MAAVPNFFALSAKDKKHQEISMKDFEGKVVLVVNVASKCGFTKQYAGLEELYKKYKDQGFVILGFPCNQFGGQVTLLFFGFFLCVILLLVHCQLLLRSWCLFFFYFIMATCFLCFLLLSSVFEKWLVAITTVAADPDIVLLYCD
jgi:hypothetical protein